MILLSYNHKLNFTIFLYFSYTDRNNSHVIMMKGIVKPGDHTRS